MFNTIVVFPFQFTGNFNELTIIYPTVLFSPNICIANLVLGLDDILDTSQLLIVSYGVLNIYSRVL